MVWRKVFLYTIILIQLLVIGIHFLLDRPRFRWAPFQEVTRYQVLNENHQILNPKELREEFGLRKFHYDEETEEFIEFNSFELVTESLRRSAVLHKRTLRVITRKLNSGEKTELEMK